MTFLLFSDVNGIFSISTDLVVYFEFILVHSLAFFNGIIFVPLFQSLGFKHFIFVKH